MKSFGDITASRGGTCHTGSKRNKQPTFHHATHIFHLYHTLNLQFESFKSYLNYTKFFFTSKHLPTVNMSSSNVGNAQVYEAGDQRNPPDSEKKENQAERFEEGKENSHNPQDPSKSPVP